MFDLGASTGRRGPVISAERVPVAHGKPVASVGPTGTFRVGGAVTPQQKRAERKSKLLWTAGAIVAGYAFWRFMESRNND